MNATMVKAVTPNLEDGLDVGAAPGLERVARREAGQAEEHQAYRVER